MKSLYSVKTHLFEALMMLKTQGLKETLRHFGWKLVAGLVVYYLVRDTLLYIVIPGLILAM